MSTLDEVIAECVPATKTTTVAGHEFTFASIGAHAWTKLTEKHRPTDDQTEQARRIGQLLDHNPETFPPAAMAESCTLIDGEHAEATVDRFRRLATKLDLADWSKLWNACLAVNLGGADPA